MYRKNQKLNLAQAVASPVLTGVDDKYVWTGLPKSENITHYMIPDEKQRNEFIRKVKDVENSVQRYKNATRGVNSVLMVKATVAEDPNEIEAHILKVCREIKTVLNNPEKIGLDLDLFWIELCREYEDIKNNNPNEFKAMNKEARNNLEFFRECINANDPPVREIYDVDNKKYVCLQFMTLGQEEKVRKHTKSNTEILLDILNSISGKENIDSKEGRQLLQEIVTPITLVDLPLVFSNRRFADMQYITVFKNYLIGKGMSYEEIEGLSATDILNLAMKTYNAEDISFHSQLVADTVIDGVKYIDMEKLMLLVAARPLEAYEMMSPMMESMKSDDDSELVKKLAEKEAENKSALESFNTEETTLKNAIEKTKRTEYIINKILQTGIIGRKTKLKIIYEDREVEISLQRVEELMNKFCDGIYMSETMQLALIYEAYYNPDGMSTWSDDLVSRMNLTESDVKNLSIVNFENLERLYSLGKMSKEQIIELFYDTVRGEVKQDLDSIIDIEKTEEKNDSKDLLKKLYESKILDAQDIRKCLDEKIIGIEWLNALEEGKNEQEIFEIHSEFAESFNQERLLEKYKQYVESYLEFTNFQMKHPDNLEEVEGLKEKLDSARSEKEMYRELFLKYNNISLEKRHDFGNELLENYYINMDVTDEDVLRESVKHFYEDGLIDLENILQIDRDYIIPMLDRLSLEDAVKVRNGMTFEQLEDMLDKIFDDPEFTDERKFIVVMNLLGEETEEDKQAREFYLGLLDFSNGERKAKTTGTRNIVHKGGKESNKFVYPDFVKWKFYKALDKDVRVTRYSNGFVEFASNKLNARIIEKYYDGDKPAYGTATYILSNEQFRNNENNLVTILPNAVILESASLREITPRKDRIAHRTQSTDKTWMDEMIKYFDIEYERENDSRYSKSELQELQAVVKKYKTEYEMIM